ncbi:hypothetical protein SELR_13050 [Selenomonas ruminantium subsp. lactilytica TAM6421]|uniref:Uncharacterized protein n=1 Tax=Selenomonas ruminantium subsp. lactilytica (strain NBRC 103574 / TAM6421) TaxID=927704 RepID=I0GQH6_SELRL|nr:hypothetical protein [Selenomonas ruminantium]BAL83013.1 hypothetical protein SELR_13050 [Selenomonas ruminantium subsp. lactilytica TAM6421]
MDISISKLHESAASAPVSQPQTTTEKNFRDIMGEFTIPKAETISPQTPHVASLSLVQPAENKDTLESIQEQTRDNLSWQAYYNSGGHFKLGEKFTVPSVLPSYEEAVRAIGPGGPYSVEAVTNCILSMAAHVAQGDPAKIAEIRQEIAKAVAIFRRDYQAATKEKDLPQICLDTYDSIMSGLDKLQAEYTQNNDVAKQSA